MDCGRRWAKRKLIERNRQMRGYAGMKKLVAHSKKSWLEPNHSELVREITHAHCVSLTELKVFK